MLHASKGLNVGCLSSNKSIFCQSLQYISAANPACHSPRIKANYVNAIGRFICFVDLSQLTTPFGNFLGKFSVLFVVFLNIQMNQIGKDYHFPVLFLAKFFYELWNLQLWTESSYTIKAVSKSVVGTHTTLSCGDHYTCHLCTTVFPWWGDTQSFMDYFDECLH